MTKTYKKRKQKRGGAGFIPVNCDYLEAKKCNNDDRDKRLKWCSDEERKKYVMYCCDSRTDKQMEEFITALKKDLKEQVNKPNGVEDFSNEHLLPKELQDLLDKSKELQDLSNKSGLDKSGLTRVKSRRRRRRRSSRRRRRRRRPKRGRSAKR